MLPPTSVDGEEIDYIKFTTGLGGENLRAYFNQYVSSNLCGMSLEIILPSWGFSEGKERIFEEWILMIHGYLKPTPEENVALLANYTEPLPIIGIAVNVQKIIVSYQNREIMEGLVRSGIVSFRVIGEVLLVKDMWKAAVEFSFTDDTMGILTTSAVDYMDNAVRLGLINELDEYERLVNGGVGHFKVTVELESSYQIY